MALTNELLGKMYYRMNQARAFDEKLKSLIYSGKINGAMTQSTGQEASAAGACMAMADDEAVFMTHRNTAQAIASGISVDALMAEMLGKKSGVCAGKGGALHLSDKSTANYGGGGLPGLSFTLACGAAMTEKIKNTGKAVLCFGGDGVTDEGAFHEALNLAGLKKLPVVFYIENNYYSAATPIEGHTAAAHLADCAAAYGVPGITIYGNDAIEVYKAVDKAASYAREGNGPFLIEAETYRMCGHDTDDVQLYRSKEEVTEWAKHDPIANLEDQLKGQYGMTQAVLDQLKENAGKSVEDALTFASGAPEPAIGDVLDGVYA